MPLAIERSILITHGNDTLNLTEST